MIVCCPHCGEVFEAASKENFSITLPQAYDIIDLCCEHFGVTRIEALSKTRKTKATKARHIAMYLIYGEEENGIIEKNVGKLFNRHRTTVINARDRCKDSLFTKGDVFEDLVILSKRIEYILEKNHLKEAC